MCEFLFAFFVSFAAFLNQRYMAGAICNSLYDFSNNFFAFAIDYDVVLS